MQDLQFFRVGGQIVKDVSESDRGGIIATKDENEGLGKDLVFSQTYNNKELNVQHENYFTSGDLLKCFFAPNLFTATLLLVSLLLNIHLLHLLLMSKEI